MSSANATFGGKSNAAQRQVLQCSPSIAITREQNAPLDSRDLPYVTTPRAPVGQGSELNHGISPFQKPGGYPSLPNPLEPFWPAPTKGKSRASFARNAGYVGYTPNNSPSRGRTTLGWNSGFGSMEVTNMKSSNEDAYPFSSQPSQRSLPQEIPNRVFDDIGQQIYPDVNNSRSKENSHGYRHTCQSIGSALIENHGPASMYFQFDSDLTQPTAEAPLVFACNRCGFNEQATDHPCIKSSSNVLSLPPVSTSRLPGLESPSQALHNELPDRFSFGGLLNQLESSIISDQEPVHLGINQVEIFNGYDSQYQNQIPRRPCRSTLPPRSPSRDQALEVFPVRPNMIKGYNVKDMYQHQHGSRLIQQKLETASSYEKDQIFSEIQPNALQLMMDGFGNYVIQKFFEHGSQVQKRILTTKMKNHVKNLSMHKHGCRVVQKALEHSLVDQQAELMMELHHDILICTKDLNGNHVIQKAVERMPREQTRLIIKAFEGYVYTLATHRYACRVIKKMIEFCPEEDQAILVTELRPFAERLVYDQYGNYVIQHIIERGKPEDIKQIIELVIDQVLQLSQHKFASNVVETTIQFGSDHQRGVIVAELTSENRSNSLRLMMKDQYANYVIKKLIVKLEGTQLERFVEHLRPQVNFLKKYNYGKHISAIEKLISRDLSTQAHI